MIWKYDRYLIHTNDFLFLHLLEQYLTSFQQSFHFLRQLNDLLQTGHILLGRIFKIYNFLLWVYLNLVEYLSSICFVFLPETLFLQTLNDFGLRLFLIIFIASSYFKPNWYSIASKGVLSSQHISINLSISIISIFIAYIQKYRVFQYLICQ